MSYHPLSVILQETYMTNNYINWFENDELFFEQCRIGQKWQEYVAEYFITQGIKATVPQLSFRDNPNVDEFSDGSRWSAARKKMDKARKEYANSEDIITAKGIIEVKSRNLIFTCPQDFPYPTVIVDTVAGWELKEVKPFAYVCVSQRTGAMICTPGRLHMEWTKKPAFDKVRQISETNYECPKKFWMGIDKLVLAHR